MRSPFVVPLTPTQYAIGWIVSLPFRIIIGAVRHPLRFVISWLVISAAFSLLHAAMSQVSH